MDNGMHITPSLLHHLLLSVLYIHTLAGLVRQALPLEVVDTVACLWPLVLYLNNSRRFCFEFAGEGLTTVFYSNGVTAFCVGRDVDVKAHDATCIDGFLVDGFAGFVSNAHQVGLVERVEMDSQLQVVVFAIERLLRLPSLRCLRLFLGSMGEVESFSGFGLPWPQGWLHPPMHR